ncbi:hypothetical protein [Cochlodiniinecator piscidefendens]|uniref:hypothetical protein n=1 Tax=Cochlodiniinecator piscidefendens TaxID=2715756 RepID=UPI00140CA997|nr:hypothetical protein [Cochlodiniinecator piscidefendens]
MRLYITLASAAALSLTAMSPAFAGQYGDGQADNSVQQPDCETNDDDCGMALLPVSSLGALGGGAAVAAVAGVAIIAGVAGSSSTPSTNSTTSTNP